MGTTLSAFGIAAPVVLAVIVAVLVIAAAIRMGHVRQPISEVAAGRRSPRWYEARLAVVLLLAGSSTSIDKRDWTCIRRRS